MGINKTKRLISNLLISSGILLIIVPTVITYMNNKRNDELIDEFLKQSTEAVSNTDELIEEDVEDFYIPEIDISSQAPDASEQEVDTDSTPPDSSTAPLKKPTMSKEEIKKRMTGVLTIQKIGVRIVVMDGVDAETLRVAAGRMPNTGKLDEIGNCVLAGHRSYTFGKYFNRLDELGPGDKITIQTSDKTLNYEVYKTYIVEPTDFSITDGNGTDKILTLFTCHPVAIATHRLVVQAKQIE